MVFDQAILLHSGQLGTHGGTLYAEIIGQLLTIERYGECAAPMSARLCGEVGKQLVPRGAMIHVRQMYTPPAGWRTCTDQQSVGQDGTDCAGLSGAPGADQPGVV